MLVTTKNNYSKPAMATKDGKMPKMDIPKIGKPAMAVKRPDNKKADGRPTAY